LKLLENECSGKTLLSESDKKELNSKIFDYAKGVEADYGVKLNELEFRIFIKIHIVRWYFP
jgi:hypothetical protein